MKRVTIPTESLLSVEGIRFIFTSFVPNFAGFGVVAVTFVALMGAGVAEAGGLMGALIRKLVVAPPDGSPSSSCSSACCRASPPTRAT